MAFLTGEAFDYNDFVKQVRGFVQGHPQPHTVTPFVTQSAFTIVGTGDGTVFVTTEEFTPAGPPGSPAGSPGPGTLYRLTCTVAGNNSSSPLAQFDVEQVEGASPGLLGTILAGERWRPDEDVASSPFPSPVTGSPHGHGLGIIIETLTDWAVSDTIEFRLVDHQLDPAGGLDENWVEDRFTEETIDVNGDFVTEWIAHAPTIAGAVASPLTPMHFGMQTAFNFSNQNFNVGMIGADDYEPSSAFASQPNASLTRYLYLDDQSFPFWLVADGDALCVVARPGSVYEWGYLGIIDVFATGNQHPKPMFVGGMGVTLDQNFSETNNTLHSAFWNAGLTASALFRWVDGTWFAIQNRVNSTYTNRNNFPLRWLSPWRTYDDTSLPAPTAFPDFLHEMPNILIPRYDDTYECLPATLIFFDTPQPAVVGDLKFVKFVPGFSINSEDEGRDNSVSPRSVFLAFQNAQLSTREDFASLEMTP